MKKYLSFHDVRSSKKISNVNFQKYLAKALAKKIVLPVVRGLLNLKIMPSVFIQWLFSDSNADKIIRLGFSKNHLNLDLYDVSYLT